MHRRESAQFFPAPRPIVEKSKRSCARAGPHREKRPGARPPTDPAGHEDGGNGLQRLVTANAPRPRREDVRRAARGLRNWRNHETENRFLHRLPGTLRQRGRSYRAVAFLPRAFRPPIPSRRARRRGDGRDVDPLRRRPVRRRRREDAAARVRSARPDPAASRRGARGPHPGAAPPPRTAKPSTGGPTGGSRSAPSPSPARSPWTASSTNPPTGRRRRRRGSSSRSRSKGRRPRIPPASGCSTTPTASTSGRRWNRNTRTSSWPTRCAGTTATSRGTTASRSSSTPSTTGGTASSSTRTPAARSSTAR